MSSAPEGLSPTPESRTPDLPPDPALAALPKSGVGLCLSGGGYRAMLFHLGSLWRLNEAGRLKTLTRVASVSGGSITAGVLGRAWPRLDFGPDGVARAFTTEVADPILALAGKTVDVPAVLLGLITGGVSKRVAGAYDRHLFHGATLQDLPDDTEGPLFIILATDLTDGVLVRMCRPYVRSYRTREFRTLSLPLAKAVAASSAFPPFLSPARLNMPDGTRFTLTDGGVYDNLGLEPVVKNCATIYVSDGGGSFPIQAKPATDWLMGTVRVLLTIQSEVGRLRRRQVVGALASKRRTGGFWAIDTEPSGIPKHASTLPITDAQAAARAATPTRLAAIPEVQRHRIVNWGYAAADSVLRSFVDPALPEPAGFPLPGGVGDTR